MNWREEAMRKAQPGGRPGIHEPLTRVAALCAALLFLGVMSAAEASAAFEQTGVFAGSATPLTSEQIERDEEIQLGGVAALAVNYTGHGGVPTGTVYAASYHFGLRVSMFSPSPGGGLAFEQSWEVISKSGEEAEEAAHGRPYARCGPALGTEIVSGKAVAQHPCESQPTGTAAARAGLAVDPTTGNVYVADSEVAIGAAIVAEFSPDGSHLISRFGEKAPAGKTIAETPAELHGSSYRAGLSADGQGAVYVYDSEGAGRLYHRLAVFRPRVADPPNYEYVGEVLAGPTPGSPRSSEPRVDDAGHLYTLGAPASRGKSIEEYAPQTPSSYPGTHPGPICSFEFPAGGIDATAVDPRSGEVFFYSEKRPKLVYRLGPCDPATGKFTEADPEPEAIEFSPERSEIWGLAFDPTRQIEPARPPGVIYAGAPASVPAVGIGNGGEPGQTALGYMFARTKERPPTIEDRSFDHVGPSSVVLRARINPQSFMTHYVFQYELTATYEEGIAAAEQEGKSGDEAVAAAFRGASEAPPTGGLLAAGSTQGRDVAASIGGLASATRYRFRVVAASHCSENEPEKLCTASTIPVSFTTFPPTSAALPDGRQWELVSPPHKNGGQVFPLHPFLSGTGCTSQPACKPGEFALVFPRQATPAGDAVTYEGTPFGEGGAVLENQYVSRRTASGWQTTTITPTALNQPERGTYDAFSTDLERGVLGQGLPVLAADAPPGYENLYFQTTADPVVTASILISQPPNREPQGGTPFKIRYAGASADLSRVFFAANDALTGEELGVAPAAPPVSATEFNLYEWHEGRLALINVLPGNVAATADSSFGLGSANAVSIGGDRVYWSSPAGQTYVRIAGVGTVEVPDHAGRFLAASSDGMTVLLTDGMVYRLNPGEVDFETVANLTQGKGGFVGVSGHAEDLSHIYFVDHEVLDNDRNSFDKEAAPGANNLYAWSASGTHFVATLSPTDNTGSFHPLDWTASATERTAQGSPDGRYFAFESVAPISAYDNAGPCTTESIGPHETTYVQEPCAEVYLYDSAAGLLRCISCNPTGESPQGWSVVPHFQANAPSYLRQPRSVLDSGRLFFDSRDSLSPLDTNEGVEDVYEWEPRGVGGSAGSCEFDFNLEGCLTLISAGREPVDSNFLASDSSAANVFFTTADQLVPEDHDEAFDLYDAREGGGLSAEAEPGVDQCQGEACQPQPTPPVVSSPGTQNFSGPGNVVAPKAHACPKGKIRRRGRCVKKQREKRPHRPSDRHKKAKRPSEPNADRKSHQ